MAAARGGPILSARPGETVIARPIGRLDLFGVPVWSASLLMSPEDRARVLTDIEVRLESYRAPGVAGQHTGSVLQERSEPWWRRYHAALFAVADHLAEELDAAWTERFVRTWGVRYESLSDYRVGEAHLHSHMGKTFSFVFALQLPAAAGPSDGATMLRNPQAGSCGITGAPVEWYGPSAVMKGIVFPGVVEHQAALPAWFPDEEVARVVLVSDVAYY